jgi:hypothetical protein
VSIRPQNKHLKPFQKGQSGNPSGRPKALLTRTDVERVFQLFSGKNREQLQEVINDQKATMLEIMIASVMVKAAKDGDAARLQFLLDRAVGKVPFVSETEDERSAREDQERISKMSNDELIEMVREKIPLLDKG